MLSLTLGHLNKKMFLEQSCFFGTTEVWEVLKSWINNNVFVWPVAAGLFMAGSIAGALFHIAVLALPLALVALGECSV